MNIILALVITLAVAFVVNLPLGFWRAGLRKFSALWFLAVHLSIPIVVVLRLTLGVPLGFAPLVIAVAVGGQLVGGTVQRRCSAD